MPIVAILRTQFGSYERVLVLELELCASELQALYLGASVVLNNSISSGSFIGQSILRDDTSLFFNLTQVCSQLKLGTRTHSFKLKLNWVANMSESDAVFNVSSVSSNLPSIALNFPTYIYTPSERFAACPQHYSGLCA